jgi:hypothetical protein
MPGRVPLGREESIRGPAAGSASGVSPAGRGTPRRK